jgi:putative SOS response-associated peptidase YedK
LTEKPSFRSLLARKRCVIPLSGYYEWQTLSSGKQAHYIYRNDRFLLAFAGLYERWQTEQGMWLHTFSIITKAADSRLDWLHQRLPVILDGERLHAWVDVDTVSEQTAVSLLHERDQVELAWHHVSKRVGNIRNQDASLIEKE